MISRHHESADMSHDELLEQLGDSKNAALVCGYSVKLRCVELTPISHGNVAGNAHCLTPLLCAASRPMRGFALPVYITAVILDFFLRVSNLQESESFAV